MHLYEALAMRVAGWRKLGYPNVAYPAIAEILEWAAEPEGAGFRLRPPQLRALETYWYLRLVEGTPHVFDLYRRLFPTNNISALLGALGIPDEAFKESNYALDNLQARIQGDDDFVRRFRLEALRETLRLDYPSYILALAMGAGKTLLIGAIFATEFGMAIEYPEGPFVQNALVFAPGKTIIESLRELAAAQYDRILPPRLYKPFAASVKIVFTRDGEKDIPVIRKSVFNVIVTNTEKIRIQKENVRKSDLGPLFPADREDEAKAEVANLRLQAIASLPHLAIFSDEAHHTYGQALDADLKKVRKTVDYLRERSPNLIGVINTTGTPYYRNQPLRDVVIWYGLSEGIRDGILKPVSGNIHGYEFEGDVEAYLGVVVGDFFSNYGEVTLPDGTPAKLAIYFPQTDDVEALRPAIEAHLLALGQSPALLLEHHTRNENKADFDRFKFKDSPHRIALLVDRGVEGWDVPALFACALARRLRSSNNFVLQAASRCLRQVPGNPHKASIYLSMDNYGILDRQLGETYGEQIADLNSAQTRSRPVIIQLRKLDIQPLVIRQIARTVVPLDAPGPAPLTLAKPDLPAPTITREAMIIHEQASTYRVLQPLGETVVIESEPTSVAVYSAAVDLAASYRLDAWAVLDELRRLYPTGELPKYHLPELRQQIEMQTRRYEIREEVIEKALALIKIDPRTEEPAGFEKSVNAEGVEVFTADISVPIERLDLLASWEQFKADNGGEFGFHYTPYNFDSRPEYYFFEQLLRHINVQPAEVEDIYFTGALTSPGKTDFYVEYLDMDGRWRRYTPDFLIRRRDGRCYIVEVKSEREKDHPVDGRGGLKEMAIRRWEELNPDRVKYQMIFTDTEIVARDDLQPAQRFVEGTDA